jgi:capsid assembly protease
MPFNALDAALGMAWAIQPEMLSTILEIAGRNNPDPQTIATQLGRPLENTRRVEMRGNVAVIPVVGPIFRRANLFTEVSGATSIEMLAQDLQKALDDPNVASILINIDSPGGEANGTGEMARLLVEARKRKPVHGYVGGVGASGAYWLASAADSLTVAPEALLGSIGIVMGFRKGDGASVEIVSSRAPHKRPDIETEEGRGSVLKTLDQLESEFINAVARNRSVTPTTVAEDFGQGGMMSGRQAVKAGMADGLGSFEAVVRKLQKGGMPRREASALAGAYDLTLSEETASDEGATAPVSAADAATEESNMETVSAAVHAAVVAERDTAQAEVVRLKPLEARAQQAEKDRSAAEAMAEIGKQAVSDQKARYLDAKLKVGAETTEAKEIAEMLEANGNYARLKQLADEAEAQVIAEVPAGTRANVREAQAPPAGGTLTANQERLLRSEAARKGIPYEKARAEFVAVQEAREARIIHVLPA